MAHTHPQIRIRLNDARKLVTEYQTGLLGCHRCGVAQLLD